MRTDCCKSGKFYQYDNKIICANRKCGNYLNETDAIEPPGGFAKHLLIAAIFIGCLFYSPRNYCSSPPQSYFKIKPGEKEQIPEPIPLTMENLEKEIDRLGMVCPEVVLAQVKLESGHLKSKVLKRSNNMFGMRYPNRRPTTAIGIYIPALDSIVKINKREELKKFSGYSSYAVYQTWQDALKDYKLWQEHAFRVNERYMKFLDKYYAEDTLYVQRVQQLARKKQ